MTLRRSSLVSPGPGPILTLILGTEKVGRSATRSATASVPTMRKKSMTMTWS